MNSLQRLWKKGIKNLRENGMKDTILLIFNFIMRKIQWFIDKGTDYYGVDLLKDKRSIFIITGVPYYDVGGGQRGAQLAKTFKKMGYNVHYFYANFTQDKKNPNIVISANTHAFVDKKALDYIEKTVEEESIFVFEAPMVQFEAVLDIAVKHNCKIIYENIDNWETSLGQLFFNENILKRLLQEAHLLVGTAKSLVKQLEQYLERFKIQKNNKKIIYLANAVDSELFDGQIQHERPNDLVKGKVTLLYYGSLWGEWFSWDLIIDLAKNNPEYAINLIGNADNISNIVKKCPSNIHFLNVKMQKELPAYLQHVDYALLPFERGEIGDYVSPLKIFEYISMYAKVLSTSLPDIVDYPNLYMGDTVAEWEQFIECNLVIDKEAADQFVKKNTWSARVEVMLQMLEER